MTVKKKHFRCGCYCRETTKSKIWSFTLVFNPAAQKSFTIIRVSRRRKRLVPPIIRPNVKYSHNLLLCSWVMLLNKRPEKCFCRILRCHSETDLWPSTSKMSLHHSILSNKNVLIISSWIFLSHGQKNVFLWGHINLWRFDHQNLISSWLNPSGCLCPMWRNRLEVFLRYCAHWNGTDAQTDNPKTWCVLSRLPAVQRHKNYSLTSPSKNNITCILNNPPTLHHYEQLYLDI